MAFELPPLPYEYAGLEPTIDEATMKLHHDKHHQDVCDEPERARWRSILSWVRRTPEELVSDSGCGARRCAAGGSE